MAGCDRRKVEESLAAKGFRREKGKQRHRYYRLWVSGEKTAVLTSVSTGSKHRTIGNPNLNAMARQIGLARADFNKFISCELSYDGLVAVLRAANKI